MLSRVITCAALAVIAFMGVPEKTAQASFFDDVRYRFSTGYDYSSGDYGDEEETQITNIPFTLRAYKGPWSANVTVPHVTIRGSGSVVSDGEGTVNGSGGDNVTTESGLGDVTTGLRYSLDLTDSMYVDFNGRVKIPTADEDKNLGTGEVDYTLAIDVTKVFGKAYIYAGGGRKFNGSNDDFQLDDVWSYSVGAGFQVTPKFSLGLGYDFREAAGTGEPISEATVFTSYRLTKKVSLQGYGSVGFKDGSADSGIGIQLAYKFDSFLPGR